MVLTITYQNKKVAYSKNHIEKNNTTQEYIFFIHGLGLNKTIWEPLISKPSLDKYTCITIDLPGSGESEFIENLTMDNYIQIISRIIAQENIQYFHLVGHSFGGYIALAFLEKNKPLIKSICLFHSNVDVDNEEKINSRKQIINIVKHKGTKIFFENLIYNQFAETNKIHYTAFIKKVLEESYKISADVLIQYQQIIINRKSFLNFLHQNDIPILFIVGQYDNFIPKKLSYEQALQSKNVSVHLLIHSAHIGMIEETEKSAEILSCFWNN